MAFDAMCQEVLMKGRKATIFALFAVLAISSVAAATGPYGPFTFTASKVFVSSRGVSVPAILTVPAGLENVPLVVMAHGHGGSKDENGGFTAIAEALAARGIASIRMDFPGCGESTEPFTQNNNTNMLADIAAARAYALTNAPVDGERVGIFGYSMGGRLAILSSADGYQSLGLLAPVGTDGPDAMFNFMGGEEKYAALASKAQADGHVLFTTPFGQVQDLGAQWFADNAAAQCLATISCFSGPILFVTGGADTIIPFAVVEETAAAASASSQIEIVRVTGADHGYGFYGGDPTLKTQTVEAIASFFALTL